MPASVWIVAAVPVLLFVASLVMALAWLGHLRFRHRSFRAAMLASWLLVLPEYVLNVFATRVGHAVFTGAQMAALHLSLGVVCVVLIARFLLGERFTRAQLLGFLLMAVSITLVLWR